MTEFRTVARSAVLFCAVLATAIVLVGYGASAMAQDQPQEKKIQEEVTVTGSLIPRPTVEAMSPVTTMDVEELAYQGTTRLEDLLTSLPQIFSAQNSTVSNGSSGTATISLRNMGSNRTLVLVDGRRMPSTGATADLNFIPAALVKRVDVLTGGASATYGADAVAGVVNFILDKEFEGLKFGLSGGGYEHNNDDKTMQAVNAFRGFTTPTGQAWDGGQFDAFAAFGGKFAEGKGHATLYLDYRKEAALRKDRRDYTNCSVSSLGANGLLCGGSGTAANGQFYTDDGGDYTLDVTGPGNTLRDFTNADRFNFAPYNFMQRPDQRYTAGGFLNYDWNEHAKGYMQIMFMDDRTDATIAPSGDFGNTLYLNCDNPMLSADEVQKFCTNAGYGPGVMGPDGVVGDAGVQILRRNVEGGGRNDHWSHQEWMFVGGVKGEIAKGWDYDVFGQRGESRIPEQYQNDLNITRIQNALFITGDPNDPSTWQCRDASARAEGCVPWDIFKKGGVTQAALNYLSLPELSNTDVVTQLVHGTVTADLKENGLVLPTASEGLRLALGAEFRKESYDYEPDLAYQMGWGAGSGATNPPVVGGFDVKEEFVELLVPIMQGMRGAQDLKLDLGYRYSDYSTSGGQNTWKVQGEWAPIQDFKLRVGKNRATRAPNVGELFSPQSLALGGSTDPCSGATPEFTAAQCALEGVTAAQYGHIQPNSANQYNTHIGGNPTLNPETADTLTYGVVITPSGFSGFTAAIDYYDIKLKNTIGALAADDIVKQCGLTGSPTLCNLIHRDQFGSLWRTPNGYTIATNANVGQREEEGIDANITYTIPAGNSFFNFNLIGSYLQKSLINTGIYSYDCVGWYGNICNDSYSDHVSMQPKWRHMFRATWETGPVLLSMAWRMIGAMTAEEASNQSALSNPGLIHKLKLNGAYRYPAYHYIDLAASYKLKAGVQWTIGVNNIADKEPPIGAGNSANDYADGFYGTYDSYGRYIHSSLMFNF
jgi:iron complex outermembrane receptor protein